MTTLEKVQGLVADHLCIPVSNVKENSDIVKDLNADSIDIVEMIMTLEDEFGISIPDEKIVHIKTVSDIVKYIDANK